MTEESRDKESAIKELVKKLGLDLLMEGRLKPSSNIYRPNQFDMTDIASQISNKDKESTMIYIKYSKEKNEYTFEIYKEGILDLY